MRKIPTMNIPNLTAGLTDMKAAAEALRDAVGMIAENRERLDSQASMLNNHEQQLESLEKRYSELLYIVGELRRTR